MGEKEDKSELTKKDELVKKSLNYSIKDGVAASAMTGLGNSYVSPFGIAMGATNNQVGLLTSVPNLLGPLFQLRALKNLQTGGSRKAVVLTNVFLQALSWLPLLLIPFLLVTWRVEILILLFTLTFIFGGYGGPAWASWMGDLVEAKKRGEFFGKRNLICGLVTMIATFIAGYVLNLFSDNKVFVGFAIIFFMAMFFRFISWWYLRLKYEPKFSLDKKYYFSIFEFVKKMKDNNFGRFSIFTALMVMSTNIAAPFFAVYMLRDLKFSYLLYMIVTVVGSIGSLIGMGFWGKYADKYGNVDVLKKGCFFASLTPLLWIIAPNIYVILLIQLMSGFAWAGFELAVFNFVSDTTTQQRRAICYSYVNILNGVGVFIGTTVGGLLAYQKLSFLKYAVLTSFLVSGILRLLAYFIVLGKVKEVRIVRRRRHFLQFFGSAPGKGLVKQIVGAHEKDDAAGGN